MYICIWKAGKKCFGRAESEEGSSCGDLTASTMMLNHVLSLFLSPGLGFGLLKLVKALGFTQPKSSFCVFVSWGAPRATICSADIEYSGYRYHGHGDNIVKYPLMPNGYSFDTQQRLLRANNGY